LHSRGKKRSVPLVIWFGGKKRKKHKIKRKKKKTACGHSVFSKVREVGGGKNVLNKATVVTMVKKGEGADLGGKTKGT